MSFDERAHRLREQTDCGHPKSGTTSVSLRTSRASLPDGVRVQPRPVFRTPAFPPELSGRDGRKTRPMDGTWAVTCFVTRSGFRRRGVSARAARGAVSFDRERVARAVEGYPMITHPGQQVTWGDLHVGSHTIFAAAGFVEVQSARPSAAS